MSHQQSFSYAGMGLPGLNQYEAKINVLAQGHNTVTSVRLEPDAPRSRVGHSTTEPLHYPFFIFCDTFTVYIKFIVFLSQQIGYLL